MSHQKFVGIQGIRGLSIISVIGFHFYPSYLPNGYLGVDQFFVISGFLMCMLLTKSVKSKKPPFSIILNFYSRRLRRILPLYFMFITATLLSLHQFFPGVGKLANFQSAPKALLFYSNQPKSHQQTYFEELDLGVDVFTHTWSLSVEVQFYLIIPFLFLLGSCFPAGPQYLYYLIIAVVSFGLSFVIPSSVAFNSTFARVWQFLLGVFVHMYLDFKNSEKLDTEPETSMTSKNMKHWESSEKNQLLLETPKKEGKTTVWKKYDAYSITSYLLVVVCCSITFNPLNLPVEFFRPLCTLTTGLLIYFSKCSNAILINSKLVYIGNISYSLYLVHWPFYSHWKLFSTSQQSLVAYLLVSTLVAVIVYETFEKWYLQLSGLKVTLLIVLLFTINVFLIFEGKKAKASVNVNKAFSRDDYDPDLVKDLLKFMTPEEIHKINTEWNFGDETYLLYNECVPPNKGFSGVCDTTGLNSSAPLKIYVFGNSWAANQYRLIHDECSKVANSIRLAAEAGCEPFTVNSKPTRCFHKFYYDAVKELQPDYAFYINRYSTFGEPFTNNATSLDNDTIYQPSETELLRYLPHVKKRIFMLEPLVDFNLAEFKKLKDELLNGALTEEQIDKLLVHDGDFQKNANQRFDRLLRACGEKCTRISYTPDFWNNQTNNHRFYDEFGLEYINQGLHLSPHGLQKVRHIYQDICSNIN